MTTDVDHVTSTCHLVALLAKTPESVHRVLAVVHRKHALIQTLRFERGPVHDELEVTLECDPTRRASVIAALEREIVVVELHART